MAQKLCTKNIERIKEVLMIAILSASRPLVEFILQLFANHPTAEATGCAKSSLFPPHLTPIMMACLNNNYGIVECLLLRGHILDLPHRFDCYCLECKNNCAVGRGDIKRIDAFRACASEAFLWLATGDPLLAAMNLLEDLNKSIKNNDEYREVYKELYDNVHNFTASIVQHCWSFEEVDLIMRQKNGARYGYTESVHPRAYRALELQMKPVIKY